MIRNIVVLGIIGLSILGCRMFDSPLVEACEASLKSRLVAPSTYRRIKVSERVEKIDRAVFISKENSDAIRKNYESRKIEPVRAIAYVEYDASNRMGVPLRGTALCAYESASEEGLARVDEHTVLVDGKTHVDWLIEGIKAAK